MIWYGRPEAPCSTSTCLCHRDPRGGRRRSEQTCGSYSRECVEGALCELRLEGVLRDSLLFVGSLASGIWRFLSP
jgi:hypothetical protein